MQSYFVVYQGMRNPREPLDIGWREFERTADRKQALGVARVLSLAKVERIAAVEYFLNGVRVTPEAFKSALEFKDKVEG